MSLDHLPHAKEAVGSLARLISYRGRVTEVGHAGAVVREAVRVFCEPLVARHAASV